MGNRRNCERKYDRTKNEEETKKEIKHENMRNLRDKIAMERNVEALGGDEEMRSVNLAHGGDEGMQIVEEQVDERNEGHGGDKEMTNVEKTMGSVDIETMVSK